MMRRRNADNQPLDWQYLSRELVECIGETTPDTAVVVNISTDKDGNAIGLNIEGANYKRAFFHMDKVAPFCEYWGLYSVISLRDYPEPYIICQIWK